jgi:hypothetical protein
MTTENKQKRAHREKNVTLHRKDTDTSALKGSYLFDISRLVATACMMIVDCGLRQCATKSYGTNLRLLKQPRKATLNFSQAIQCFIPRNSQQKAHWRSNSPPK